MAWLIALCEAAAGRWDLFVRGTSRRTSGFYKMSSLKCALKRLIAAYLLSQVNISLCSVTYALVNATFEIIKMKYTSLYWLLCCGYVDVWGAWIIHLVGSSSKRTNMFYRPKTNSAQTSCIQILASQDIFIHTGYNDSIVVSWGSLSNFIVYGF